MARLAANYPGQALPAETATEWFGPLAQFPAAEVWDAVDRHRRDMTEGRDGRPRGAWMPNLAELLAAVDKNWREQSAARRELETRQAKATRPGVVAIAPPEWTEIRRIIEASKGLPGEPGHMLGQVARDRIQALIDQHNERVDREQAEVSSSDAPRVPRSSSSFRVVPHPARSMLATIRHAVYDVRSRTDLASTEGIVSDLDVAVREIGAGGERSEDEGRYDRPAALANLDDVQHVHATEDVQGGDRL